MARTNIDLDDELVAKLMDHTGIKTKRALVDTALKAYYKKLVYAEILNPTSTVEFVDDIDEIVSGSYSSDNPSANLQGEEGDLEVESKAAA